MIVGIRHFTDRIGEGIGQPRFDSVGGEELMHVQPGITIALGRLSPESPGTLYISNRRVIWLSDTDRDKCYSVDFLSISLHAVSRDPETYPSPCIYTQASSLGSTFAITNVTVSANYKASKTSLAVYNILGCEGCGH
ncbi:Chloride conductance regulatory protein ICln [Dendrobium catenatum]|uniref:Chloride conductance regulatory protein ICln n=1 Tax=Dendrobium catenatum TaxID=906689 RepID=A0A2I0WCX7_9ASPA|nr:Chloride conductance regulatory protein ICln [Dendrobium catenatum]